MSDRPGKIVNFGKRIIGAVRAAAQQEAIVEKRTRFGPRVLGTQVIKGTNTPAPTSAPAPKKAVSLSVSAIKATLERNRAHLSQLISQEEQRPGGPRVEALEVFEEYAAKIDDQIERELVLGRIEALRPAPVEVEDTEPEPVEEETVAETKAKAPKAGKPATKKK